MRRLYFLLRSVHVLQSKESQPEEKTQEEEQLLLLQQAETARVLKDVKMLRQKAQERPSIRFPILHLSEGAQDLGTAVLELINQVRLQLLPHQK